MLGHWEILKLYQKTSWLVSVGISLIFLLITTVLLIKDLDQPKRFFYVLLRPQWKSWLVRGGYSLTLFGGLLTLIGLSFWLEWTALIKPVMWLTAALAVLTAVYTAFLFAQAKGRDFWQSPTMAMHMLVHSIMAGAAAMALSGLIVGSNMDWDVFLKNTILISFGFNLITILVELITTHPTSDAKLVVEMITKGRYAIMFWWGTIIFGNLIPIIILLSGFNWSMPVASFLLLAGIYFTEKNMGGSTPKNTIVIVIIVT